MRMVVALIVMFGLVVAAGPALAKKCESEDAKKAVVAGKTKYDLGRYDEAIALWERVYEECPSPGLLFNLAQAHRMLGNNDKAITLYRSWLRESTDADPKVRREVEDRVVELAALVAAQHRTAEKPPQGIATDGGANQAPADDGPAVPEAPIGPATGPPETSVREAKPWYADRAAWILVATGAASAAVGSGFLLHASGLRDDALADPDEAEVRRLNNSANTYRVVGASLLVAGLAVTAGGIVKLVLHDRPPVRRTTELSIGPTWIGITGRF